MLLVSLTLIGSIRHLGWHKILTKDMQHVLGERKRERNRVIEEELLEDRCILIAALICECANHDGNGMMWKFLELCESSCLIANFVHSLK